MFTSSPQAHTNQSMNLITKSNLDYHSYNLSSWYLCEDAQSLNQYSESHPPPPLTPIQSESITKWTTILTEACDIDWRHHSDTTATIVCASVTARLRFQLRLVTSLCLFVNATRHCIWDLRPSEWHYDINCQSKCTNNKWICWEHIAS